ncbi:hypothetical protein M8818_004827 [Zalaria obscura]|uniref:Uncharacterized protein n=1 Tax=Zalaria obscura TaxID=2024903 RepID=A0ACC3SDT8_9PEZI
MMKNIVLKYKEAIGSSRWAGYGIEHIEAHFFISHRGSHMQKSIEGLMRCLLHQICSKNEALARIALAEFAREEIEKVNGPVASELETRLRICLASRPWPIFADSFSGLPDFTVEKHTQADIPRYVFDRMESHPKLRKDLDSIEPQLRARYKSLQDEVVGRARGIFLWVRVVVDLLLFEASNGAEISDLEELLSSLPLEVENLYATILRRTLPKYHEEAYLMLELVFRSPMPLDLQSFCGARQLCLTREENFLPERHPWREQNGYTFLFRYYLDIIRYSEPYSGLSEDERREANEHRLHALRAAAICGREAERSIKASLQPWLDKVEDRHFQKYLPCGWNGIRKKGLPYDPMEFPVDSRLAFAKSYARPTKPNLTMTPLHVVVADAHTTELLLAHGADINAHDSEGLTPLDYLLFSRNSMEYQLKPAYDWALLVLEQGARITSHSLQQQGKGVTLDEFISELSRSYNSNDKIFELLRRAKVQAEPHELQQMKAADPNWLWRMKAAVPNWLRRTMPRRN